MRRALRELVIVGLPTSQAFHLHVMDDPAFQRGELDINYLERAGLAQLGQETRADLVRPLAVVAALLAEERRAVVRPPIARVPDRISAWQMEARREALRE
jgi:acetyl/propionyl-CoA carboxylase alpha subunit